MKMENEVEKYIMFTDFRGYQEAVRGRLADLDEKISRFRKAAESEKDELALIDHENMIKWHEQEKRMLENEFMQTMPYDECVMQYWIELSNRGSRPKFRLVQRAEKIKFENEMAEMAIHTYA